MRRRGGRGGRADQIVAGCPPDRVEQAGEGRPGSAPEKGRNQLHEAARTAVFDHCLHTYHHAAAGPRPRRPDG